MLFPGLAADVGTLQRLPKIIGSQSLVRDLCFTARKFMSDEALSSGLVSRVYNDKDRYSMPNSSIVHER
jgi:delta(3,5)-delta(2,4)-dienoyl-CoA isomerase